MTNPSTNSLPTRSAAGPLPPRRAQPSAHAAGWRDRLAGYRRFLDEPVVDVADLRALSAREHRALSARLDAANMALYRVAPGADVDHAGVLALGRQFGLAQAGRNLCADDDAVSEITARDDARGRYIPYTDRALSWHTDGYYEADGGVRAFVLHCVRPAVAGGANRFLDHEILHGLLQHDPGVDIEALFENDAYTIPANVVDGVEIRPAIHGAVFEHIEGALVMRFSARQRNIAWKDEARVRAAVSAIREHLDRSPLVLSIRLEAGMGVISRNVLHCREAFVDDPDRPRMLLRVRYHDAIAPRALSGTAHDLA